MNGVLCTCHRFAMAHTLDRVRERIRWWQTDLAYAAPEQITSAYLTRMLNDLMVAADGEELRSEKRRVDEHA
jgi:hypothetical protein